MNEASDFGKGAAMNFDHYPRELHVERVDGVLTATINNPAELNAVNEAIDDALPDLFVDADRDPETRVLVLTGAGRAFCAGGSLSMMQSGLDSLDGFMAGYQNGKRMLQSMIECDKPIIAKVNGDAIGLGATLALFADVTIAAEEARFCDPHVKVGLVAGDGGSIIWPANMGYALAKYFLLTGEMVSAREAQAMGLIAKVTTRDELDAETDRIAQKLAKGAQQAIRFTKRVINIPLRRAFVEMADAGFALEAISSRHHDHGEGCNAFLEKRRPVFE